MKKPLLSILICAALLFALASCGEIIARDIIALEFDPQLFVLDTATLWDESPWHLAMQIDANILSFEDIIEEYEAQLWLIGAEQTELQESETHWFFRGTYGEDNRRLNIAISNTDEQFIEIFIDFMDEPEQRE